MSQIEPRVPLDILDPGQADSLYWDRFQRRVMTAVRPHLSRRRDTRVTVERVMLSWSRLVLPVAVAAAIGAVVLARESSLQEVDEIVGLEEVLEVPDDGAEPLPTFLHSDEVVDRDILLLAVEGF
jgi:hypothetical protein